METFVAPSHHLGDTRLAEPRLATALTGDFRDLATLEELKQKYTKGPAPPNPKKGGKGGKEDGTTEC